MYIVLTITNDFISGKNFLVAEQFSLMIENTCVTSVKSATAAVEALLAAY